MRRAFGRPRGGSVDGLSQCEARFFFCARPAWPAILSGFGTSKMRSKPTDIWRFNKSNIGFKHVETTKNCRLNTNNFQECSDLMAEHAPELMANLEEAMIWGPKIRFWDFIGLIWSRTVFIFHSHEVKTRLLFPISSWMGLHPSIAIYILTMFGFTIWYSIIYIHLLHFITMFWHVLTMALISVNRTWWRDDRVKAPATGPHQNFIIFNISS